MHFNFKSYVVNLARLKVLDLSRAAYSTLLAAALLLACIYIFVVHNCVKRMLDRMVWLRGELMGNCNQLPCQSVDLNEFFMQMLQLFCML